MSIRIFLIIFRESSDDDRRERRFIFEGDIVFTHDIDDFEEILRIHTDDIFLSFYSCLDRYERCTYFGISGRYFYTSFVLRSDTSIIVIFSCDEIGLADTRDEVRPQHYCRRHMCGWEESFVVRELT